MNQYPSKNQIVDQCVDEIKQLFEQLKTCQTFEEKRERLHQIQLRSACIEPLVRKHEAVC